MLTFTTFAIVGIMLMCGVMVLDASLITGLFALIAAFIAFVATVTFIFFLPPLFVFFPFLPLFAAFAAASVVSTIFLLDDKRWGYIFGGVYIALMATAMFIA